VTRHRSIFSPEVPVTQMHIALALHPLPLLFPVLPMEPQHAINLIACRIFSAVVQHFRELALTEALLWNGVTTEMVSNNTFLPFSANFHSRTPHTALSALQGSQERRFKFLPSFLLLPDGSPAMLGSGKSFPWRIAWGLRSLAIQISSLGGG
jgi:hypothetical protein